MSPVLTIPPGSQVMFTGTLTTPSDPGSELCELRFRMVQEFIEFFGEELQWTLDTVNAARDWTLYR
jgi:hypothetical protein